VAGTGRTNRAVGRGVENVRREDGEDPEAVRQSHVEPAGRGRAGGELLADLGHPGEDPADLGCIPEPDARRRPVAGLAGDHLGRPEDENLFHRVVPEQFFQRTEPGGLAENVLDQPVAVGPGQERALLLENWSSSRFPSIRNSDNGLCRVRTGSIRSANRAWAFRRRSAADSGGNRPLTDDGDLTGPCGDIRGLAGAAGAANRKPSTGIGGVRDGRQTCSHQ
jgi:hypothetical protein